MKRFLVIIFFTISFLSCFAHQCFAVEKLMPEKMEILCGYTNGKKGGEAQYCDIAGGQSCVECIENKNDGLWADFGGFITRQKVKVYHCQSEAAPLGKKCQYAMNGGLKGDEFRTFLAGSLRGGDKEGENCIVYNYFIKYSNCYGCVVVKTLTSAFVKAAAKAYDVSKGLGNVIVLIGTMIWIAFFILKNVSSLSAVDPMQMLQQLFVQIFKVVLAMVILNSGLETILHYTLVPIITTGTDLADTITANVSDVIASNGSDVGAEYWENLQNSPMEE